MVKHLGAITLLCCIQIHDIMRCIIKGLIILCICHYHKYMTGLNLTVHQQIIVPEKGNSLYYVVVMVTVMWLLW